MCVCVCVCVCVWPSAVVPFLTGKDEVKSKMKMKISAVWAVSDIAHHLALGQRNVAEVTLTRTFGSVGGHNKCVQNFGGEPLGNRPLERPRLRWVIQVRCEARWRCFRTGPHWRCY
jgi:hypothetical protein